MKKKTIKFIATSFTFIWVILVSARCDAQVSRIDGMELIDSLLSVLPTLHNDSNKVKTLDLLSFRYFSYYPEKGLTYGEQGRALAVKLGWKRGEANACNSIGANYWAKNDFLTAQDFYLKALKINEQLGDKKGIAQNLHNIADIYAVEYNYSKALEFYNRSLFISKSIADTFGIYGTEGNIADIYKAEKDYAKAISYLTRAIKIAEQKGWHRFQAASIVDLGELYGELGDFAIALQYENTALTIFRSIVNNPIKDDIANTLSNLGAIFLKKGDYSRSRNYYRQAYYKFEKIKGIWTTSRAAECLVKIAECYYLMAGKNRIELYARSTQNRKGNLTCALDTLQIAIGRLKANKDWVGLRDAFLCLSKVQERNRGYAESLTAYKQYAIFKDSVSNINRDKLITDKALQYGFEKQKDSLGNINAIQAIRLKSLLQEEELSKLKSNQRKIYITTAATIFCLVTFLLIYRYRNRQLHLTSLLTKERAEYQLEETKQKNKLTQATLTALISQMNPHFIFNALNTIQSYVYTNDKKNAVYYLGKFSDLTRKILYNSNKEMVSLEEEIEQLQLYIEIEKARFGDSIEICINVDPSLDLEGIMLPPMLIQPHVENAIKHGLLHQTGEKKLSIKISGIQNIGELTIEISDNGIGRQQSFSINRQNPGHRSFSTTATEKRIELINGIFDKKIKLEIIDKKDSEGKPVGTSVIIHIPVMFDQMQLTV
ncbi:MAG: tetratricopeptide repeat protein [Bacteroidota bacterium]|nr:tetratricopeptide repeat protein [Bacteroidota bacterium]